MVKAQTLGVAEDHLQATNVKVKASKKGRSISQKESFIELIMKRAHRFVFPSFPAVLLHSPSV
jgi:hypothetical protein